MTGKELIRKLQADGWVLVATKGSHLQFKHPSKVGRVTVPHPKRDLPRGTVHSIYRQASNEQSGVTFDVIPHSDSQRFWQCLRRDCA
ncbi:type II toxin-antitoxin system HicA family toxin [Pseudohongiella spirulinae]|uniref:type II toxin-antitoxin system HicA family toxin n=1 Tax=Pseudohongiella spirulinae TaxID=1249552 RepID=UPI0009EBFBC4